MNRHQHATNNAVLGAPTGVSHEDCMALPITRVVYATGEDAVASYWMPTNAERELIAQGKAIRLLVMGRTHPPLLLGVDGDGLLP